MGRVQAGERPQIKRESCVPLMPLRAATSRKRETSPVVPGALLHRAPFERASPPPTEAPQAKEARGRLTRTLHPRHELSDVLVVDDDADALRGVGAQLAELLRDAADGRGRDRVGLGCACSRVSAERLEEEEAAEGG